MVRPINFREIVELCRNGEAKKARKALTGRLEASSPASKAEQMSLLDGLFYVEIHEGRKEAALKTLKRRRDLGFRNTERRMDAVLDICTLLFNSGHFMEARTELIELLHEKKLHDWHGLLQALSLYVDVDRKSREQMDSVLSEAFGLAIRRLGIPIDVDFSAAKMPKAIKAAHRMFLADAKAYSGLLSRVFAEPTQEGRQRLIGDIRELSENANAAFFKDQAAQLLNKLESNNGE